MNLFKHQIEDATYLASKQIAGCFNEAGTGKTLTALYAAALTEARYICVLSPPVAEPMWQENLRTFLGCPEVHSLNNRLPVTDSAPVALTCTYTKALTRAPLLIDFARQGPSVLICDESHALKSMASKITQAVLGFPEDLFTSGIWSHFTHTWMLTGTPILSWADDLIPFLFAAAPAEVRSALRGKLTVEAFQREFCVRSPAYFLPRARRRRHMNNMPLYTTGTKHTERLSELVASCATTRKLKSIYQDRPALVIRRHKISACAAAFFADSSAVDDDMEYTGTRASSVSVDTKGTTHSSASLPTLRRNIHMELIDAYTAFLCTIYRELNEPILVGAWHVDVLKSVQSSLQEQNIHAELITGATNSKQRTEIQERFNRKTIPILLGQIASIGVSLNLQQGSRCVVLLEKDWSPSTMNQFVSRVYRIGQKETVYLHLLDNESVVDRAAIRVLDRKDASINQIVKEN